MCVTGSQCLQGRSARRPGRNVMTERFATGGRYVAEIPLRREWLGNWSKRPDADCHEAHVGPDR